MTNNSDLSPEDVRKAQALADQLDPDTARAIQEGNVPVIQAIKRGARTDAEITQTLISMGLTTGLPPGLQQMVNEQEKQNSEKRDPDAARAERLEKLASGAFGMGLTGGAGNDQTSSSGSSTVRSCAEMSFAEKSAYFGALASMSYGDYAQQSDGARQQHIDNVKAEGMAQAVEAKKELEKFPDNLLADPKLGATPEERQAAKERIYAAADYDCNAEQFHENLRNLKSPAEREAAVALRALYYKANFGSDAHDKGNNAQDAKNKGKMPEEHGNVRDGADDLKQINDKIERDKKYLAELNAGTNKLNQVAAAPTLNVGKASAAYRQSDAALDGGGHSAHTKTENDNLQVARADNLAARKTVDAKLASAEHLAATTRDEYDDAPAPPERKSIDCARMTCSQLEPPLPEAQKLAANDPAPEPPADPHQPQKPAVPCPKNDGTIT
jgi:hypothetical protein